MENLPIDLIHWKAGVILLCVGGITAALIDCIFGLSGKRKDEKDE